MSAFREGFDQLLALLDEDRERAGERYEALRHRLCRFFAWKGALAPDELADETLDRVARRLAEGEHVEDVPAYVHGVARNVLRESWARARREATTGPLGEAGPGVDAEASTRAERRHVCLDRCLQALPAETCQIVLRYYAEDGWAKISGRQALARTLGVGLNALRIRMHRVRARLEGCVRRCLGTETDSSGDHDSVEGGRG